MLPDLRIRILGPVSIENARAVGQTRAQSEEGALLGNPYIGIGRVRQEEPIEMRPEARALDVLEHRLHGGEDSTGRLIVDRHDDRGARGERVGQSGCAAAVEEEPEEADESGGECDADPRKIGDKEDKQRPFERGDAADFDDLVHFMRAVDRQCQAAAEYEKPRNPGAERKPFLRNPRFECGGRNARGSAPACRAVLPAACSGPPDAARTGGHAHIRAHGVHAVHRYSQVSLTGLPPTSSNRRISEKVSLPGSMSKTTRQSLRFG